MLYFSLEAIEPMGQTPDAVLTALRAAGFDNVQRRVELGIFSEYTATKPV
jgi:hypothetical protein